MFRCLFLTRDKFASWGVGAFVGGGGGGFHNDDDDEHHKDTVHDSIRLLPLKGCTVKECFVFLFFFPFGQGNVRNSRSKRSGGKTTLSAKFPFCGPFGFRYSLSPNNKHTDLGQCTPALPAAVDSLTSAAVVDSLDVVGVDSRVVAFSVARALLFCAAVDFFII